MDGPIRPELYDSARSSLMPASLMPASLMSGPLLPGPLTAGPLMATKAPSRGLG